MQIDRMEAFLVRLPLKQPFSIANTVIKNLETVFFRMNSGGLSGWGEVTPGNNSYLTSSWSRGVFAVVKDQLLPLLTQQRSIESGEKLKELFQPVKGNRHAKAVIDLAFWDLYAKYKNLPLWKALGGSKQTVEVGMTFDRNADISQFLNDVKKTVDEGFRRITLKLRPGWDIQMVNAVRSELPPLQELQVDVEGTLEYEKHSDILFRLEDFFLSLIEQPLNQNDYVGHTMLAENLRTPIGLDESIKTLEQAAIAIDLRSAEVFCMKPGRVGGLTEAKLIHQATIPQEISCYGGFDIQSSVGYRHLIALASLSNFNYPCDYLRFSEVFVDDPGIPLEPFLKMPEQNDKEIKTEEKTTRMDNLPLEKEPLAKPIVRVPLKKQSKPVQAIELWAEPGIGCAVDLDIIEKYAIDRVVWEK
ncbi:MAG: enolase C-terminal domain-like protein [Planctomycetia bacterium]|nr:enolase C-terminal domain-like protein [Planctomycetia bacterium]